MARNTLGGRKVVLRDQSGVEHAVELGQDGSVVVSDRMIRVVTTRRGEVRAGERTAWLVDDGTLRWVFIDGQVYTFEAQAPGARRPRPARHDGGLSAPMPATVIKIPVSAGDRVRAGDVLIILEAMKMELPLRAATDGIVASIGCHVGELVQPGQDLIEITPERM